MLPELTPDNAQFLQDQVATGQFASGDEAINAAVALLRRQAALRAKIERGIHQLDNGQYVDLDEEGLDRFFEELFAIAGAEGQAE